MPDPDKEQAEALLTEHGMSQLLPVQFLARRLGCTIWQTRLYRKYGDANVQVQIYLFREEPESVVDFEEDFTALTDDFETETTLVKSVRTDDCGILVTCNRQDKNIVENALNNPGEQPGPAYHPQLDRILDGDYFHQLNGRWLKACLSSIERAMQINELLKKAEEAYKDGPTWPGKLESPMPGLLAVLQIPAMELSGAPPGYQELALSQFIIESPEVVEMLPPEGDDLVVFAQQLFGFVGIEHRQNIGFCRNAGCCLRPEFLVRSGALTDVYFMADLTQTDFPVEIKARDLLNASLVTCEMASDVDLGLAALKQAVASYTLRPKPAPDLEKLIEAAMNGFSAGQQDPLYGLIHSLARQ